MLLSNICSAYVRDATTVARGDRRTRCDTAAATLRGHDAELPLFSRIVATNIDTYDRRQLDLSIEIFLSGVEAVLLQGGSPIAG